MQVLVLGAMVAALTAAQPALTAAQPMPRCAACHFANMASVPAPEHLGDWERSAHAKHNVGCDQCHGGNPWTYEPLEAHRGVLNPASPGSPVNGANLVRTCARCHAAIAESFSASVHQTLAAAEGAQAPTCIACHGEMSARVPSPAGLEARCGACHPAGSPRKDYAAAMHRSLDALNVERLRADVKEDEIARITDRTRRAELTIALREVRSSLAAAIAAAHTFDIPAIDERVDAARKRLDSLR